LASIGLLTPTYLTLHLGALVGGQPTLPFFVGGQLFGRGGPGFDPLGQLDLELAREQRDLPDLLQIRVDGIGPGAATVIGRGVRTDAAPTGTRLLPVHHLVRRLTLERLALESLERPGPFPGALVILNGGEARVGGEVRQVDVDGHGAAVIGQGVDDDLGHGHGHGFGQSHRSGTHPRLLEIFDAFGAHARHDVLDDVVRQLDGLEDEDQIVLREVPALTPDGEQLLEAVESDTFRCRPYRTGRRVNLAHSFSSPLSTSQASNRSAALMAPSPSSESNSSISQ